MKSLSKEFFEQKRHTVGFFAVQSELKAIDKFNWNEKTNLKSSSKKDNNWGNKEKKVKILSK
jgi:peptidyl-tRNA hydrolase